MYHICRVCGKTLDSSTMYKSQIKKHNWICKACDNKRRWPLPSSSNQPKESQEFINIYNHSIGKISTENSIILTSSKQHSKCSSCTAYISNECHLNPPPYPKVIKDVDWCRNHEQNI